MEDPDVLREVVFGKYVEIGSQWGYSAVIAAEVADHVTCIDPMESLGQLSDFGSKQDKEFVFWETIDKVGIRSKITLVKALSDPWPLEDEMFDTALIDGNHSYGSVIADLRNLRNRVKTAIILDDVHQNKAHMGVRRALGEFWGYAVEWRLETRKDVAILWRGR